MAFSFLVAFGLGAVAYLVLQFLFRPDPLKLLNIYGQPGKWYFLKFHLMRFIIDRRQKKTKKGDSSESKNKENLMNSQWGGDGGERDIEEMEKKHDMKQEWSADAVFFDASNRDGWYFTLGTAQRPNDIINLFFILRIPGVGTFVNEELHTDTNVKSIRCSEKEWKTESGFIVSCIEPMKKWRIRFNGKLASSPGKLNFVKNGAVKMKDDVKFFDANFDLTWTNFGAQFDFDKQCSPTAIAHSLAIEPWSRGLFDKMRASHQTHYEQFGKLVGDVKIGDHETKGVRMTSMRDHTIAGFRRWSDIRRYIMMIYHLEDGTCIHTSVISMPETVFSHLEFGYIVTPNGETKPVDRVHFSLPNHGEDRDFPNDFHYSFEVDGKTHYADVHIKEAVSFKMGLDQACQVNEGMAEYVVDRKKGWGFAEVEYRIQPY
ncbi:hypothetical protein L5515_003608 [Caenorhabditis briggsae]|uniref:DUF7064 domain-containing protein n=1 Tax=Caenorhabditis briggsae TaxID=6238 RepID=A0AAE9EHT6_CAEBR|nr:hypothetical protein L5515_003608 [Caenorhabditis briggsae]